MPYKNIEDKRKHGRKYSKEYYQKMRKDKEFLKDRKERLKKWKNNNPDKIKQHSKNYYKKHKAKISKASTIWQRKNREKIRKKLFEVYGEKCACCGEDEFVFLTIDHINGGGKKDFEESKSVIYVYKRMIKENDKTKYQTMCWNCNQGKRISGICSHKNR